MRVLMVHGSTHGGTADIAEWIADVLREQGHVVDVADAASVSSLQPYQAVVVGSGLYAGHWTREAREFVLRHTDALRERRVWFFSSGPLDGSAQDHEIAPTPRVAQLMRHVGAEGHATFGGRLDAHASGFIASRMARIRSGDWRNLPQVEAWAGQVSQWLAREGTAPPRGPWPQGRTPAANAALFLCMAVGLSALVGGVVLMVEPDGALLQLSPLVLAHTPFRTFFVPGLVLAAVVGTSNLWSAVAYARDDDLAPARAVLSGLCLLVWICVQMALLRTVNLLQVTFLMVGTLIVLLSIRGVKQLISSLPKTA